MNKLINTTLKSCILERGIGLIGAQVEQSTGFTPLLSFVRWKFRLVELPLIGRASGNAFRRIVHFPEKYTIEPLPVTNLAGRDPITGRVVVSGIGGGIKHKYHWVDFIRVGPKEGPPLVERVLQILKCGCRTSDVALVGNGEKLRYILATENLKVGDIIRTSGHIPRIPVRANEGDAYPLGALPQGTVVNSVENLAGLGGSYAHAAGTCATVGKKIGEFVTVVLPSKREIAVRQECMAVVGRISNINYNKIPIGSPQANRWLGNRPRSGWWQRKGGKHGRKIRRPPPMRFVSTSKPTGHETVRFTLPIIDYGKSVTGVQDAPRKPRFPTIIRKMMLGK